MSRGLNECFIVPEAFLVRRKPPIGRRRRNGRLLICREEKSSAGKSLLAALASHPLILQLAGPLCGTRPPRRARLFAQEKSPDSFAAAHDHRAERKFPSEIVRKEQADTRCKADRTKPLRDNDRLRFAFRVEVVGPYLVFYLERSSAFCDVSRPEVKRSLVLALMDTGKRGQPFS
ncbi:hypothetical protein EYF80_036886 [Liparis tanakae]|uniref:Uncharacterized protein n=1 Tax=Liparis tanakae TaxID=230148 RepID=A0A4Z2GJ31_9TELE|nr:hypothetical protein EYF80_036886 [Liparis tanakae]